MEDAETVARDGSRILCDACGVSIADMHLSSFGQDICVRCAREDVAVRSGGRLLFDHVANSSVLGGPGPPLCDPCASRCTTPEQAHSSCSGWCLACSCWHAFDTFIVWGRYWMRVFLPSFLHVWLFRCGKDSLPQLWCLQGLQWRRLYPVQHTRVIEKLLQEHKRNRDNSVGYECTAGGCGRLALSPNASRCLWEADLSPDSNLP